jgi:hypothetical protein
MSTEIPREVFAYFAASPIGPMLQLPREAADSESPVREPLERFLAELLPDEVAAACADPHFQFFAAGQHDLDRRARVWIAERRLAVEIAVRKLEVVRSELSEARPRPYDLLAVADLDVDDDHLVPLSAFEFDGARLTRNGHAFTVLTTTGSPNSTYWLLRTIYDRGLSDRARVRLDPFLFGPQDSFAAMHYLMWMYGRSLDWSRLANLTEPDFGQWRPASLSRDGEFTDFAWTPRGREVHFVCEEVPSMDDADRQPARYLHAVYDRTAKWISHLDGALRLYNATEIRDRQGSHVRNAGRVGIREKVFRCEGDIPPDVLCVIAQAFFVWNEDVRGYFGRQPATDPAV